MANLDLTIACSDYDQVRDFASGRVRAEGIDARFIDVGVEEMFYRFLKFREFDVTEMSLCKYASMIAADDRSVVALPVFPSRLFRLSSFYVRADSGLSSFRELEGKRIGVPEWAQTATVYARGYLAHEAGVPLPSIKWFQAGVDEPGRDEKVALTLPKGVELTSVPDRSLRQLLLDGSIDAVITANPPKLPKEESGKIRQLVPDFQPLEEAYFKKTGVLPIMHTIVVRGDLAEKYPWMLLNLFKAFEEAKERSVARISSSFATRVPVLWLGIHLERTRALFGSDYWPYGIDSNRKTLEAFLLFAFEQGICSRHLAPEDLFPENVTSRARI
ncbi:MAG TPA: hypothetical protein VNF99_07550 [Stellaceae bacterium]|nr:hypothetical protein [Stellaceae bacterium]